MPYRSFFIRDVSQKDIIQSIEKILPFEIVQSRELIAYNDENEVLRTLSRRDKEFPNFLLLKEERLGNWLEIQYYNKNKPKAIVRNLSKNLNCDLIVANYLHDSGYTYFAFYQKGKLTKEYELVGLPNGPKAEFYDGDYSELGVKVSVGEKLVSYEKKISELLLTENAFGARFLDDCCRCFGIKIFNFHSDNNIDVWAKKYYVKLMSKEVNLIDIRKKTKKAISQTIFKENSDKMPF